MFKNKTVLIAGGGGFIGGHLAKKLLPNNKVIVADIKPLSQWFQKFPKAINYSLDLKVKSNCLKVTKRVDFVFNLACNMGGMGFIENNKAECMLSVLINTNLLEASRLNKISKFFFASSACVYNGGKQNKTFIKGLKESDAYPADPEDGYGWEKLFSERMCRHFYEDFGLETRIARFHNIYGPYGTYDGGREKAPAAMSRKIANLFLNKSKNIEVWGDGKQTRSFLYVDDCIEGSLRLFKSNCREPVNIGSDEQVSINQLIKIIQKKSKIKKLQIKYNLNKPLGVRGRSSDNSLCKKILKWEYKISLTEGLSKTFDWILNDIKKRKKPNKFSS